MKTSELIGPALEWAVAKCEGLDVYIPAFADKPWLQIHLSNGNDTYCQDHSTKWSDGGPIIEREGIQITPNLDYSWRAIRVILPTIQPILYGPTPLIAAMRCYVASKLGDEVEIPKELK